MPGSLFVALFFFVADAPAPDAGGTGGPAAATTTPAEPTPGETVDVAPPTPAVDEHEAAPAPEAPVVDVAPAAPAAPTEEVRPGSGKRRPPPAVPVLAAAGAAFLGAATGTGTMVAAVLITRAAEPPDEATPEVFAGNAALTLGSLGLPVLLAVAGGAAGGWWTWGLEVALTSGFGATVGAAAGAAVGIATASSLPLATDPALPLLVHGACVAAGGTVGAALGAIGGVFVLDEE